MAKNKKIKYVPSRVRGSKERKISAVTDEAIVFSDGSKITFDHNQDCCEDNYADFKQLDNIAQGYTFIGKMVFKPHDSGFLFGDSRRKFFVPCYSSQNGYYTSDLSIYYNGVCQLNIDCEII